MKKMNLEQICKKLKIDIINFTSQCISAIEVQNEMLYTCTLLLWAAKRFDVHDFTGIALRLHGEKLLEIIPTIDDSYSFKKETIKELHGINDNINKIAELKNRWI